MSYFEKMGEAERVRLENVGAKVRKMGEVEKLSFFEICERLCDDYGDPLNPLVVLRDCMVPSKRNNTNGRIAAAKVMLEYGKGSPEQRVRIEGNVNHELRNMSDAQLLVALAGDREKLKALVGVGGGVDKLLELMGKGGSGGKEKEIEIQGGK